MSKVESKKTPHEEVAVLRELDGVLCAITKHTRNNIERRSFSFAKEYDLDGATKRSHWLDKRHLPSIRALIDKVESWLEADEDKSRAAKRRAVR